MVYPREASVRRFQVLSWLAAAALGVGFLSSGAVAKAADEPEAPAATSGDTSAVQEVDQIEMVADAKKGERTGTALSRMRQILTRVIDHLKNARAEKDIVKLNCVNDKLTNVKGLLRISEQADVTMQEAIARRDTESAEHEFTKVIIAQRKTEQLLAESEACVGELAVYAGDTEVEMEVEDEEAVVDPVYTDTDPTSRIPDIQPAAATPYR